MRRNDLDICAEILEVARGGARKTRIVYTANLNFRLVETYLRRLMKNGMIRQESNFYMTTEKGSEFIRRFQVITGALG